MANSRDFTGKNRKFTGTKGIVAPKGTTGERVGSESGELRFNTTTELMEYYDGTQWKAIDAPPSISSITTNDATGSGTVLNADGSTLFTITINGGNFGNGLNVQFIGSTGTVYTAGNITRVSASQITCTTLSSMGTADDPYDVRVTNVSGLSIESLDAFTYNAPPVFTVASGQLGTVYDGQVISGTTLNAGATDAEGNTITFTIISGSLPGSGLSISSSTGAITGTLSGSPSLGNYPFVVRAATTEGTVERQFSIQVVANPFIVATGGTILTSGDFKTHVFTSPGTFTVSSAGTPAGSTTVEYLVVGAGGSGSGSSPGPNEFDYAGGGGGAGGYRQNYPSPAFGGFPVSAQGYPITVGAGGGAPGTTQRGVNGNPSIFSTITSTTGGGGGSGGSAGSHPGRNGNDGGSGGGGGGSGPSSGGSGNTPPVSPSQGNPGGPGFSSNPTAAGGGGGAGASGNAGTDTSPAIGGPAGVGSPIATDFFGPTAPSYGTPGPGPGRYFAGGGGGAGGYNSNPGRSGIGGSGGGGNGAGNGGPSPAAVAGTVNTGGGGGGAQTNSPQSNSGGNGGSGIVAIRYKFQ
jgi:hypothetical protein